MNLYSVVIFIFVIGGALLHVFIETLNLSKIRPDIPDEFKNLYDQERYRKSQNYLKDNTLVGLVQTAFYTPLFAAFIVLGGFNHVDQLVRKFSLEFGLGELSTGLLFLGVLGLIGWIIGLPFSYYHHFVLEEQYGFNRMTLKTFVSDQIKGILLGSILGGILFSVIYLLFEKAGDNAWLYAWGAATGFELFLFFIAPVVIFPLFNKFTPLPEGELKNKIEEFAKAQNFKMQGIFKMDGSKRTSKANAYFTGFGKFRRIVLFDTLIEKQSVDELTAILAHEIGHYKLKHVFKQLGLSIVSSGLLFYLLSIMIFSDDLFQAFHMQEKSIYTGIVFAGILYSPISSLIGVFSLYLSRKYEFEADAFAAKTYKKSESLVQGLKKLSVESLSNLNPHPLKVALEYTHPPVLERIAKLREYSV